MAVITLMLIGSLVQILSRQHKEMIISLKSYTVRVSINTILPIVQTTTHLIVYLRIDPTFLLRPSFSLAAGRAGALLIEYAFPCTSGTILTCTP